MAETDPAITTRPITDADLPFLEGLYASTRAEELAPVPWTEAQKRQFLRFQFEAQHRYYQEQFTGARFDLIVDGERPIGRLYVDRRAEEIRLIDIALAPEHRNRGIGGRLMRALLAEAEASGKAVTIHVEHNNPALRLYRRLGFRRVEDRGVYHLMAWSPAAAAEGSAEG